MKTILKGVILCAASIVLSSASFGQVKFNGVGPSIKAKTIDTASFSPQIDANAHTHDFEKDHEWKFTYPPGTPNNLVPGGVMNTERISLASSALFPGISATGAEPPDPDIAVGPNHVVEVVNSSIAFYKKDGTKVFEQTFQNFFKSVSPTSFDYDPKVIYDQVAKRFVVLDLDLTDATTNGASDLLIAVSNTSDPNGTWKLFKVDVKQTSGANVYWWDYPGLGYNKDMIVATGNMFAMSGSSGFNGVQIVAFDKATLYGGTATPNKFQAADGFTCQLAKTEDSTSNAVYGVETWTNSSMRLTAISKTGNNFAVTQSVVTVPTWQRDAGSITGPNGVVVQTNDPRQLVAASFQGSLVSAHSVAVSNSDARPAARWYQFNLGNWPASGSPTLKMSGQVNPPAGHGYSFPAINFDSKGSLGMTFSKIGASTPGDVMGTGRKATDPAGVMGAPILLEKSTASSYNGFSTRWGDYFDVELDPSDSKTFWAVGMGAGQSVGGRWQTYMKSFKISLADTDLTSVNALNVTPVAGAYQSGDNASLWKVDGNMYNMSSLPVGGLGQVAGFLADYKVPFTNIDTLRMFLTVNGPTGSSAIISLKNQRTGSYETFTTLGLSNAAVTKSIDLTTAQIGTYVSSNGSMSVSVRYVLPGRAGAMPAAFNCSTEMVGFGASPKS